MRTGMNIPISTFYHIVAIDFDSGGENIKTEILKESKEC